MKVLFAGTPGVLKSSALEKLREAAKRLFPEDRIFTWNPQGGTPEVPVIEKQLYPHGYPVPFLKLPQIEQKNQWREKFRRIQEAFNRAGTEHHFLGLHFTFRYQQIPICPVDLKMLLDWKPDCIVTFIDDAYCIRQRIHKGGYGSFTLAELVLWRAEELLIGDLLAQLVNPRNPIPNYVVSVKHPAEMLARLLLRHDKTARVYLSYCISKARSDAKKRDLVDTFRRRMHSQEMCVAFDPLTIDELPPVRLCSDPSSQGEHFSYDTSRPDLRWPVLDPELALTADGDLSYPIDIPVRELRDVSAAIDAQVKNRDIRLVDQAHFLIVYRPTIIRNSDGSENPAISSGVQGEVDHASQTSCRVIWYIKRGEDPLPESPFAEKNPGSNPDMIYEEDEARFWDRISKLHLTIDRERDYFLR
jgi:hypothetical protein